LVVDWGSGWEESRKGGAEVLLPQSEKKRKEPALSFSEALGGENAALEVVLEGKREEGMSPQARGRREMQTLSCHNSKKRVRVLIAPRPRKKTPPTQRSE